MKDALTYNGYVGSVHFSGDDLVFYGKIEGIADLVTFEGKTVDELTAAFSEAVDDYLELCRRTGKTPLKSCKGSFNVRVAPEIHRRALETAAERGISLNLLVQRAIENEIRDSQRA